MSNALTYLDDDSGAAFEPQEPRRLIFEAWLNHGPGHDEKLAFYLASNTDETFEVLWLESDMAEDLSALAWLPKGNATGEELVRLLLSTYWRRDKEEHDLEGPNFTELFDNPTAALHSNEIDEIIAEVWPPTK